jgi:prepilin-type N-terminal cleavage/methylation domain-containing protein
MKFFRPKNRKAGFTLVEIMIVVLIIGILLAIAIPNFVQARESARAKACIGNLKQLDSASQQWAMDNKKGSTYAMVAADFTGLAPTYLHTMPTCPSGGNYTQGATVSAFPICTYSGIAGAATATGVGDYAPPGTSAGAAAAGKWFHGLQ